MRIYKRNVLEHISFVMWRFWLCGAQLLSSARARIRPARTPHNLKAQSVRKNVIRPLSLPHGLMRLVSLISQLANALAFINSVSAEKTPRSLREGGGGCITLL